MKHEKARQAAAYVTGAALLIGIWGGYVRKWPWTGFGKNGQLWDWMNILLLPVVLGTIPAGYLVPLKWTGFHSQKLWNWLVLLVLPAAVATAMTLLDMSARGSKIRLRPYQKAIIAALAAGWIVTVIGGYALNWGWTGYAGNTLWDWLSMLLPLVFPMILLPPLLRWVSGDAAGRASAAREAAGSSECPQSAAR